ncbi:unnamed protein product [Sphagnum jensenii]|uniref:CHAT domain-containing protein n=1 Tax=Sphagnum jensenii TaxID=128206 RepID=A0ABP1BG47_9BRYO
MFHYRVALRKHSLQLAAKVGIQCQEHYALAQVAIHEGKWQAAMEEWMMCLELVEKSLLDVASRQWLVCWISLLLANLFGFCVKDFGKAFYFSLKSAELDISGVRDELNFHNCAVVHGFLLKYLQLSAKNCDGEAFYNDVNPWLRGLLDEKEEGEDFLAKGGEQIESGVCLNDDCEEEADELLPKGGEHFLLKIEYAVCSKLRGLYQFYRNWAEVLRWARRNNQLHIKLHPGSTNFVSKWSEASVLIYFGAWKEGAEVLIELRDDAVDKKHHLGKNNYSNQLLAINNMLEYYYLLMQKTAASELKFEGADYYQASAQEKRKECAALLDENMAFYMLDQKASDHKRNKEFKEAVACYDKCLLEHLPNGQAGQLVEMHCNHKKVLLFTDMYRQSYENSSPDESHFLNAKVCLSSPLAKSHWTGSDLILDHYTNCGMVRLYHERDRKVMFLKQSQSSNSGPINADEIVDYGKKALKAYTELLNGCTQHTDDWINLQEKTNNEVCYALQFHIFASWIAHWGCTLENSTDELKFEDRVWQLWRQSVEKAERAHPEFWRLQKIRNKSLVWAERAHPECWRLQKIWNQSLVWAERARAKAMLFQLGPKKLNSSAIEHLHEFDMDDDLAWEILKSTRAACGPRTVVVEYFYSKGQDIMFFYVMTKDDKGFMEALPFLSPHQQLLMKLLDCLRGHLSGDQNTTKDKKVESYEDGVNTVLEFLYLMLISPIAAHLADMNPEDKLIFVAPEVLSSVPFSALRKPESPEGEGYLIQSHTISVTPSLRVLHHCSKRSKELDDVCSETRTGAIVAVGDPKYHEGQEVDPLPATCEEVKFIEKLFGKEYVVTLLGPEATPSKVLKWAKYPSKKKLKQAIVHIAAHGKRGAIVLAEPSPLNCGTVEPQQAPLSAQDDENGDCAVAHNETKMQNLSLENTIVDVQEPGQPSRLGEVGGMYSRSVHPIPTSGEYSGILKSENISGCGFKWKAQMVVLSACDTSRGEIKSEGALNLPQALMIAGVPCTVVSHWKVKDSLIPDLMKHFYQNLRKGEDAASSLRAAMLQMLKDKHNVGVWAPFVVCGLPTVRLPAELLGTVYV